jgi:hypothetical protein
LLALIKVSALIKDTFGLLDVFHEAGVFRVTEGACEFKESVARIGDLTATRVWNVILLKTQSINGLCQVSQLSPTVSDNRILELLSHKGNRG